MGDHLKKVQSGDPMVIPAQTFNAFVDAAFDFQRRQRSVKREGQATFQQNGVILVRNNTGGDLDRFAAVGIDAPIIGPDDNEDEFKNRASAIGVKPAVPLHRGRFAIMLEPVASGGIAPACVSGVVPCQIEVDEETHERADVEHDSTTLRTGHHGGAEILWKEAGQGLKWAMVKIGVAEPLAITFDVQLEQVDGESGENCETDCTFKYDIFDIHTSEKLNDGEPQAPIRGRPSNTEMIAATRGTAFWTVEGDQIAVRLEEAFEQPTPRAQQNVVTGIYCESASGEGEDDCCKVKLTYYTSLVCYPPGVKIEDGPTYTFICGSGSGYSSGSGSTGPPSSGSPDLPPPPSEPGYYQLCVCHDGTIHWQKTGETSCGSSSSDESGSSGSSGGGSSGSSSSGGSSSGGLP